MGQLRPGDKITFRRISLAEAERLETMQDRYIRTFEKPGPVTGTPDREEPAVIAVIEKTETAERVVYRRAGDKYILVEYGDPVLDLKLRFRVHILMEELETMAVEGIQELTPGIRSLQIRYDNQTLKSEALLDILFSAEERINRARDFSVRSRIVHLPLSWDDPSTHTAIQKYTQSVRPDAPWCPSNIDFIRRINGLDSVEQLKDIVFGASYLVMGLGDVYLGAPVATPMDPRNRLVTTKYNPARTWTPENAVGIGGAYLCVYGMEGPGGYQFVGRTLQMWNRYNVTPEFEENKPWLLRFFDQIRFYPVSGDELMKIRQDFPHGLFHPVIEETVLNLEDYEAFLGENRDSIRSFKEKQQAAFDRELQLWIENGQMNFRTDEPADDGSQEKREIEEGAAPVVSPVSGSIWKINVTKDQTVKKGDILAVMECMKMEIEITANTHGTVGRILCAEGTQISSGDCLMGILPERTL
jgi:urea carboxylase